MLPIDAASYFIKAGFSVIPILCDQSKAAAVPWKEFQTRIAREDELNYLFGGHVGIAILGGAVSGGLEMLDIEAEGPTDELLILIEHHLPGLLEKLARVLTPTGGRHIFYRCDVISGNQKLASTEEGNTLIETRGEGGYVITVTSPAECHPSGKEYKLLAGSILKTPRITVEQRDIILSCCRSFNRLIREDTRTVAPSLPYTGGLRPGDDYNARGDALGLLLGHGWKVEGKQNGSCYLRRPGKEHGISATFGRVAPNVMYVFSSNAAPFENERAYDAFGIFKHIMAGGDAVKAAQMLRKDGFGEPLPKPNGKIHIEPIVKPDPEPEVQPLKEPTNVVLNASGQKPAANLTNAVILLESDPKLLGVVWYDAFLNKLMTGDPPREWKEVDDLETTFHIQRERGIDKISNEIVSKAIMMVAHRNVKNCVQDWLITLKWDRVERVAHCFEDHFGAPANLYVRAVSKNFWLSLVARVFLPGCKSDYMVVLEGKQGAKKSTALNVIGGNWYTDQMETAGGGKAFFEAIQGKMIVEISDFSAFKRADVERIKQVITCRTDRFRDSYGHYASDHQRTCIFVATTNRDDWNRDETGARRFWPIKCQDDIDVAQLKINREQLFAEAVALFQSGATWWEMPFSETAQEQDDRYEHDAWQDFIVEWVGVRQEVTVKEVMTECLKFDPEKIGRADQMRVGAILRHIGWIPSSRRIGDRTLKVWARA